MLGKANKTTKGGTVEQTTVVEARKALQDALNSNAVDEVLADLEAKLTTAKQVEVKAKAEVQKAEVLATQQERAKIVEDVSGKDGWVKYCKKHNCPVVTVDEASVKVALAIVELVNTQPDIGARVVAAKGIALQYQPADATSEVARARVVTATVKGTGKPRATGGNGKRGKLVELWDAHATADEIAALATAIENGKTRGVKLATISWRHKVNLQKRLINEKIISVE